ncbi:MAG TPA: hypothetical protein VF557_17405 [Jatrophihabitans sp.]|jgi:hypothetical protein|uniref:hypothetical protein n=1 Tax=Jatrophihabitans sp. TaxID=1932789 RepID=UPI002EF2C2ED
MTSPVFGLPHLSEDAVAAFADGVLSAAAASRARRHCAECVECADAVRGQRETAMMLRAAQAPALPSGLLDRLAGLPMSTPLPPPSRGGLPTVLGADGTAMFIAHDAHKARGLQARDSLEREVRARDALEREARDPRAGQPSAGEQPEAAAPPPARPVHRRAALPVTVLASAAAVVAAGTFGGQVSTLAAVGDRQAPAGAANVVGSVTGSQNAALRSSNPLNPAVRLGVSRPSAGPASTDQPATPALRVGLRADSVTLAPVPRTSQRSDQAASDASWSRLVGAQAEADRSVPGNDARSPAGFEPTPAGAPVATP